MRALTSASGMPREWLSKSRLGQISCSVKTARFGRQWSRKFADELGGVERDVLMNGTRRQPARGQLRRRHGAGGEQHPQLRARLHQRADKRKNGVGFADAGGVTPGQHALGPKRGRLAQAARRGGRGLPFLGARDAAESSLRQDAQATSTPGTPTRQSLQSVPPPRALDRAGHSVESTLAAGSAPRDGQLIPICIADNRPFPKAAIHRHTEKYCMLRVVMWSSLQASAAIRCP